MPGECWKMQGNARGTYGSGCKLPGECRGTYGSGCSARGMQGSAGEFRGIPGKRMGVSVNCQGNAGNAGNAGECQGNVWERVYSARGMQGTTNGMQGSGCKELAE